MPTLTAYHRNIVDDLSAHTPEFDAIVVGGDMHAVAIGAVAAAALGKSLMTVCTCQHDCVVSHIVTIGDVDPRMRFLYMDDFYSFGATKRSTFDYMRQSDTPNIVATYQAITRDYVKVTA